MAPHWVLGAVVAGGPTGAVCTGVEAVVEAFEVDDAQAASETAAVRARDVTRQARKARWGSMSQD